ncbi:hypothetical protein H4582DRAFT_2085096 [Lactarius indigo]|nr:hypothetical protein H4582DRAFT_2085096 [Lactarius indigo]
MSLLCVRYGAYLSKEQIAKPVALRQDTLKLVHSWLQHHGVPSFSVSTSHGDGWLITGVSQADKPLSPSYQLYNYTGADTTEVILRTISYALPAVPVHAHVRTVALTTCFAPQRSSSSSSCECDVEGAPGTVQDYASHADLTRFMTNFRLDAVAATFTVNTGGWLQWVGNQQAPNDAYLVWLDYILDQDSEYIPPTISISWGNPEPLIPLEYASSVCTLFARLGLRVVSALASTNDDGSSGDTRDSSVPASSPSAARYATTLTGGVPPFLEYLAIEYAGFHNPEGHGIPDISAQARKFNIIFREWHDRGDAHSSGNNLIT